MSQKMKIETRHLKVLKVPSSKLGQIINYYYTVHELLTYCIVITNYDNVITYIFKLLSMT